MTNPAKYQWPCEPDAHVYANDVTMAGFCTICGKRRETEDPEALSGISKITGTTGTVPHRSAHDGRPVAGRLESSVESGDFGGILLGVGNWSDTFPLGASGGSTASDITG